MIDKRHSDHDSSSVYLLLALGVCHCATRHYIRKQIWNLTVAVRVRSDTFTNAAKDCCSPDLQTGWIQFETTQFLHRRWTNHLQVAYSPQFSTFSSHFASLDELKFRQSERQFCWLPFRKEPELFPRSDLESTEKLGPIWWKTWLKLILRPPILLCYIWYWWRLVPTQRTRSETEIGLDRLAM